MRKFIFVIGGARSGKSSYAQKLAKGFKKPVAFIATAQAKDKEMKERIRKHKSERPQIWKTIEEAKDIGPVLQKISKTCKIALVDCLGLLVSNLMVDGLTDKEIEKQIKGLISILAKLDITVILVSNEVGGGVVPDNTLARRFRDLVGFANQRLAAKADEVILMQSGIPLKIKGEK